MSRRISSPLVRIGLSSLLSVLAGSRRETFICVEFTQFRYRRTLEDPRDYVYGQAQCRMQRRDCPLKAAMPALTAVVRIVLMVFGATSGRGNGWSPEADVVCLPAFEAVIGRNGWRRIRDLERPSPHSSCRGFFSIPSRTKISLAAPSSFRDNLLKCSSELPGISTTAHLQRPQRLPRPLKGAQVPPHVPC
ncbi:hypothetical protein NUW54_g10547 [Trametes sanguinea]|uniref:Uncharacterized protein n=1 Tax=Trametes sanguinea TaxID=158606 RepID=A0ACC1NZD9_9APHY|nr:hypothetical protein NUW54_g10547 [Trametes sanguinea]